MMNKTLIGIMAGVAGTLLIGYCIYFDNVRRNAPDYKKKVRERRVRDRKFSKSSKQDMPDLSDPKAVERYFLQELQAGELLVGRGHFENGIKHLANAIIVCNQPNSLLEVLQSILPQQVFAMLIARMQEYSNRLPNVDSTHAMKSEPSVTGVTGTTSAAAEAHDNISGNVIIDDLE